MDMPDVDYNSILAESVFKTTQVYCEFYEKEMVPQFKIIYKPTIKDNALSDAYQKMYLFLLSLTKLDHKQYFQTVIIVVRSMFELYLDMICLDKDKTEGEAEKYFAHTQIARYKVASKISEYMSNHPETKLGSYLSDDFIERMNKYKADMEEHDKIRGVKLKYWSDVN